MNKYDWLDKRTLRAVDQLRLWADNPRLDPQEKHNNIADYTTTLIHDSGEKESFFKLINSIANNGFIPADPVVVWQDGSNSKYFVAEGNRRVLALKLLRNPAKAPSSIRNYIRQKAALIDRNSIEKIKVNVAPSFESCEWYINQRHFSSSIQRPWSRLQIQRWIAELYDKYDGDIEQITVIAGVKKSEIEATLRILKIRDLALEPIVLKQLSKEEQAKVKSHRIPMTILERFFFNAKVKEKWGLDFDEDNLKITANRVSFLNAYACFLKLVINREEPNVDLKINTRTITSELDNILTKLPDVSFAKDEDEVATVTRPDRKKSLNKNDNGADPAANLPADKKPLNKNPDRNQLIVPEYQLTTSNYKLDALFREFKKLPVTNYKNTAAVSLRVFLDLAVAEFIDAEGLEKAICTENNKGLKEIALSQRLKFLKNSKFNAKRAACKVIDKLLNHTNDYSLDTLNNYIHGNATHHTSKRFLNGFWDFLFPLFEALLDIKEK